jgi:hypothetical protein
LIQFNEVVVAVAVAKEHPLAQVALVEEVEALAVMQTMRLMEPQILAVVAAEAQIAQLRELPLKTAVLELLFLNTQTHLPSQLAVV